ncbi:MAG: YdcF family protein [Hyphomonadaceae bacterium]|nr:YdcF family protein [Hyphomonadaceae bacterium]MBY0565246.1 YdcF family protein [Hyphomonadaceae bacterium]
MSIAEVGGRREELLNDAADRIRLGASLARTFPDASVYVLGGQAFAHAGGAPEAEAMANLLSELGVARARIVLERTSRTTAENARNFRQAFEGAGAGQVIVVTSAFHMPRAMASMRAQCIKAVAAPTDWRANDETALLSWSASASLATTDLVAREYLGLLAYRLRGLTDELVPSAVAKSCSQRIKLRS